MAAALGAGRARSYRYRTLGLVVDLGPVGHPPALGRLEQGEQAAADGRAAPAPAAR